MTLFASKLGWKSHPPHSTDCAILAPENGSLRGEETPVDVTPVTPDIYNWEGRYESAIKRLHNDPGILKENRAKILAFLQSREARGLSIPRIVKYANHLIVVARLCTKKFEAMSIDDVRELLVKLKNREKEGECWKRSKGEKYSDLTLSDIKSMLKVFWRWMKGMDKSKPVYPPEVNWFTEGRYKSITVTRSDLLTEEEVDLLAKATDHAQDTVFIKLLDFLRSPSFSRAPRRIAQPHFFNAFLPIRQGSLVELCFEPVEKYMRT